MADRLSKHSSAVSPSDELEREVQRVREKNELNRRLSMKRKTLAPAKRKMERSNTFRKVETQMSSLVLSVKNWFKPPGDGTDTVEGSERSTIV